MVSLGATNLALSGIGALFLVIGLYAVNGGRNVRDRSERIAETDPSRAGDVRPGPTKVKGTAEPTGEDATLEAPFSNAEALATHVEVEGDLKGNVSGYETIYERQDAVPFLVDDGTGTVRVDPIPEEIDFDPELERAGVGEEPSERVRRFVETAEVDEDTREMMTSRATRRYHEGLVERGDEVFVFGEARPGEYGDDYVIDRAPDGGEFIVSQKPEGKQIGARSSYGTFLYAIGGGIAFVGAVLVLAGLLI